MSDILSNNYVLKKLTTNIIYKYDKILLRNTYSKIKYLILPMNRSKIKISKCVIINSIFKRYTIHIYIYYFIIDTIIFINLYTSK